MSISAQAVSRRKVLLFIHGIRHDDASRSWLSALDAALRREGLEDVRQRGYEIVAPSYLKQLEATTEPVSAEAPPMTYRKGPDDAHGLAAGSYWSDIASLERTGIRGHVEGFDLGDRPANLAADLGMPLLFADAVAYRKSETRRHAIFARILRSIPSDADLVIIAHSLGSVVAADLLYHLPPDSRLRMLITIGSPLGFRPLREHLARRSNRFPYEIVGPWVNIAGTKDMVTGFRGLSRLVPEALDVFIDTGNSPRQAHSAAAYLDNPAMVQAFRWLDDRHEVQATDGPNLPVLAIPESLLPVLVGAQYALRLEQTLDPGDRRARFSQARRLVLETLQARLADAGQAHPATSRLTYDNSDLLKGRPSETIIALLLSAWRSNPVMPYEIRVDDDRRRSALEHLAIDLGVPSAWARAVAAAEEEARESHDAGWNWTQAALVVAGAAAIVAAPVLVLAAAPAGLAGGAAIVAGLAALGPGGMLGGIGIVSVLGGAGGAVAAQALASGTAAQVEATVIYLQAFAKLTEDLTTSGPASDCWSALLAMEDAITDELARHRKFSDSGAGLVKELKKKLQSVRRAVDWLSEQGLGPARLV